MCSLCESELLDLYVKNTAQSHRHHNKTATECGTMLTNVVIKASKVAHAYDSILLSVEQVHIQKWNGHGFKCYVN